MLSQSLGCELDALLGSDAVGQASGNEIRAAAGVVLETFDKFRFEEVALSFNGGKDCTVVMHLVRLLLPRIFPNDQEKRISKLRFAYFDKGDDFDEMITFVKTVSEKYGFQVLKYCGNYKVGLEELEKQGVKAVLMGQRKTDPYGSELEHFTKCTPGWPQIMRVNPILMWSYATIWTFLRSLKLEYCSLYDEGYTSLGSSKTTKRHPALASPTANHRPAYELENGDVDERISRS